MIQKKFKVTYSKHTEYYSTRGQKLLSVEIEASSKYDAKKRFYHQHPEEEIVKVVEQSETARECKEGVDNGFSLSGPSRSEKRR